MATPCGTSIGHEDCGYHFTVPDQPWHIADNNSWTRTKSKRYRNRMMKQQKLLVPKKN